MNFSFPPLSSTVERRRLLPLALLVLLGHVALVLAPSPCRAAPGPASRIPIPADDTPELLRLSRAPAGAAAARLAVVPLGAPPPPPSLPRTLQLRPPGPLLAAPERDQLAGLQRRQWWLSAAQESLAQQLWQTGSPVTALPDALGPLPDDGELRRLGPGPLAALGSGDWHGHSLLSRQGALLIWRQVGDLWLLRLPWPRTETLTSS